MYSSQAFLAGIVILGLVELFVWKGMHPQSFEQTFDPVQREQLEIVPRELSLGKLAIGEKRPIRVSVTNRKDRVVTLRQPKSTCGCIRFTLEHPIDLAPGETTQLAMNYTAPSFPGRVNKSVLVQVEGVESSWKIPLTGQVMADSWANPPMLDVVIEETMRGVVHFNSGEEIGDVIVSDPDKIKVTLGIPARNAHSYKVQVDAKSKGEGYIAFLSATADCLATVPIHWGPPSVLACSPSLVILDAAKTEPEQKTKIVVLRESAASTELVFLPQVDWMRIEEEKVMSDRVINLSIVADHQLSPHSFNGEILRVLDKKSGQTFSIRGRI